jgi:flavin reductase (DIM6/NTAB) family NADH-FMN oxidoreductase RutF
MAETKMHLDLAQIPTTDAYKLLVSTVVPRPIALATTVDGEGRVNAAPFSFFNAVSSVPPVVVLGISTGAASEDGYKDTEPNIRDSGEFVVNLVDEALAERMNVCAIDFPAGTGELNEAELMPLPSVGVRAPRIDPEKMYVRTEKMRLIGRMHGRGWYDRTSELFLMDRVDLENWEANKG